MTIFGMSYEYWYLKFHATTFVQYLTQVWQICFAGFILFDSMQKKLVSLIEWDWFKEKWKTVKFCLSWKL